MGLMISSEFLEDLIGFEGLAVGYLKGARPEDDRFWTEIPVPMMSAGPISFLGGVIGLEKFLRGGFTFDAGFPWLREGIRAWDRGFGFTVGIYVGHAGFYMKYLPGTMPGPGGSGASKTLLLAGGFGVAVGYGFCMTFAGVFTVYASIEVYAIIEGSVLLRYEMPALPASRRRPPRWGARARVRAPARAGRRCRRRARGCRPRRRLGAGRWRSWRWSSGSSASWPAGSVS